MTSKEHTERKAPPKKLSLSRTTLRDLAPDAATANAARGGGTFGWHAARTH